MVMMMELSFRQMILLHGLKKLNGERTMYSLYHLLQGKKSSQTIQDAYLFGLYRLFQTDMSVTRAELERHVCVLKTVGFLQEKENQRYLPTKEGERALEEAMHATPFPPHVNGWKYGQSGALLWERLSLAVQVISHLQQRETRYLPVQRKPDTLLWLKAFLRRHSLNRRELAEAFYRELTGILERDNRIDPTILVVRLSGSGQIGLTAVQAAQLLKLEPVYYHYQFLNIMHYLSAAIAERSAQFPLLSAFLDKKEEVPLTQSTKKTYSLLQQGFTIDDIIRIRRLKRSTIEDHLVEIALHIPQFSLEHFVSLEKQEQIKATIRQAHTKRLREIRKRIPEASYFEIRLVLARFGDESC